MRDKLNLIKIGLSGLIAEDLFTNDRSDGAQFDIQQAKKLSSELVRVDGYAGLDKICILPRGPFEDVLVAISSNKRMAIEKAEDEVFLKCYEEAKELINNNKFLLQQVAERLLEKKSLDRNELLSIYENSHAPIKETSSPSLFAKEVTK